MSDGKPVITIDGVECDVRVLRLQRGDHIVVTFPPNSLTAKQAHAMRDQLRERFGEEHEVTLLAGAVDMCVVRSEEFGE